MHVCLSSQSVVVFFGVHQSIFSSKTVLKSPPCHESRLNSNADTDKVGNVLYCKLGNAATEGLAGGGGNLGV